MVSAGLCPWHKGNYAESITWIGTQLQYDEESVTASLMEEFMQELRDLTAKIAHSNLISRKLLATYAGKCNHVTNILFAWKPFLESLWGALYSSKPSQAPKRMIWRSQIQVALDWIRSFLRGTSGSLSRTRRVGAYLHANDLSVLTLDA